MSLGKLKYGRVCKADTFMKGVVTMSGKLSLFVVPIIVVLLCCGGDSVEAADLADGFLNPPLAARPRAYWDWMNGNVCLAQLTRELEDAKEKGMGGFDIFDVGAIDDPKGIVPAGPAFLGPESLEAIDYAVRQAGRLGLELGFITSSSWNAGGPWIKPEHGQMALFYSQVTETGPDHPSTKQRDRQPGRPKGCI